MARQIWIMDDQTGKLLTPEEYQAKNPPSLQAHMVIEDTMPPTEHTITGEIFTSKSAFRAVTKAHGCIEIGNESVRKYGRQEPIIPDPIPILKEAFKGFRE